MDLKITKNILLMCALAGATACDTADSGSFSNFGFRDVEDARNSPRTSDIPGSIVTLDVDRPGRLNNAQEPYTTRTSEARLEAIEELVDNAGHTYGDFSVFRVNAGGDRQVGSTQRVSIYLGREDRQNSPDRLLALSEFDMPTGDFEGNTLTASASYSGGIFLRGAIDDQTIAGLGDVGQNDVYNENADIDLEANFGTGTLTGVTDDLPGSDRAVVNGEFRGRAISGNVNVTIDDLNLNNFATDLTGALDSENLTAAFNGNNDRSVIAGGILATVDE